ncbi:hypothetical protein [Nitrosomonas europaea]|uniref:hypothetical protein n=1 Tax=Nitrosomonas europaea TaxID=915 RepID=UPI00245767C9|nr:hypothetical protein [Nitrosomonas europaea]
MMKALLAQQIVGSNSTDRGKNGSKRHLLVDGRGVPLSLIVTGPAGMTSASCQQCWRPSWSNVRTYRSDVTNTRVPMPVTLVLPHS